MARPLDAVAAELERCGTVAPALLVGALAEELEAEETIIAALAGDLMGSETLTHGLLVLTPQRVLDHVQVSRGPMLGGGTSLHCTVIPLHDVAGVRSTTQSDGYQVLVSVWGRTADLHIDEAFDAAAEAREAWARRAAAFVSAVQALIPAEPARSVEQPSAPAQAPHCLLAVVAGPLAGTRFPLPMGELILGRGQECEVKIPDPELSRRHGRLLVRPAGVTFTDLESANGSYVNGARVTTPRELQVGDELCVGGTRLVLEPAPTAAPPAAVEPVRAPPAAVEPLQAPPALVPTVDPDSSPPLPPREPVATSVDVRCWFCEARPPEVPSTLDLKLYRDVERRRSLVGSGVRVTTTWRNADVSIPRCAICAAGHARREMLAKAMRLGGAALGGLLGLLFVAAVAGPRERNPGTFIAVMLIVGAVGLGVGWLTSLALRNMGLPAGTRPARQAARFPAVERARAEGWRVGAKPPPELTGLFIFVGILLFVLLIIFLIGSRRRF